MYPHSYSPGRLWFLSRPFLIAVLASFPHVVHFPPPRKARFRYTFVAGALSKHHYTLPDIPLQNIF